MASKRQRRKRRRRAHGAPPPAAAEPGQSRFQLDDRARARPAAARATKGPPPAPWGTFPLSELVVLVALILLVGGFFVAPPRGAVMIGAGLVLGSLAGLELAIREHFAGYRSHTLLLAGAVGIGVIVALVFLGPGSVSIGIALVAGLLVFGASAWGFALAFRRRSGGALFRFRGR